MVQSGRTKLPCVASRRLRNSGGGNYKPVTMSYVQERVHETATAWKDHDPAARNAADTIKDQVKRRFGLDADNLSADETSVATALANAERDRERADRMRGTSREEKAQTTQLLAEAAREDQERQKDTVEEKEPRGIAAGYVGAGSNAEASRNLSEGVEGARSFKPSHDDADTAQAC